MEYLIILGAVPFFLLMIGLELYVLRRQSKPDGYRFNDTITNLNIGIGNQVFNLFFQVMLLGAFSLIYDNFSFWHLPANAGTVLLCIVLFDFLFYWAHRWSHELNFWWGAHVVHHSSEEYNLSVALRQSWLHNIMAFVIFVPLPLLGFDPSVFLIAGSAHTLYQFWIHTKTIQKMPKWFEAVFNTPSHHRVHHGVNPKYIDKNHAGVFIIWDKLFGTFQAEEEEVVYGITSPLKSWNPVWANIHYYVELVKASRAMKFIDKLRLIVARPGWRPDYMGGTIPIPEPDENRSLYNATAVGKWLNLYVLVQFVLILAGLCTFMYFFHELSWLYRITFFGVLILSTMICGAIMENKAWVAPAEYLRLVLVLVSLNSLYYIQYLDWFLVMVIGSGVGFVALNLWFTLSWRNRKIA